MMFFDNKPIQSWFVINSMLMYPILGGGFKYFICSPLPGEDSHFDEHIFQMGWFNHQPEDKPNLRNWLLGTIFHHWHPTNSAHGPMVHSRRGDVANEAKSCCDTCGQDAAILWGGRGLPCAANPNEHVIIWGFPKEAGRPPECSFLLIYEIEISQVITSFHHHIKTWNLTIYFNVLFPEVNLFHLNQLAFII